MAGNLGVAAALFHLRMVQLSGNATLALIAGMLHEIFERHTSSVTRHRSRTDAETYEADYRLFIRSQRRLLKRLRARDGEGAFVHRQEHMVVARSLVIEGPLAAQVLDLLD